MTTQGEAFEVIGDAGHEKGLVLICDHASNRVPPPLEASAGDREVLEMHWGWDIGARAVTWTVVEALGLVAVASRFSRLVCDPNREPWEETWARSEAEGHPLSFNQGLTDAERARRRVAYHDPYHGAVDALFERRREAGLKSLLIAMHSFTSCYEGERRAMEVGVMFDARHADEGERLCQVFESGGFVTARNAPYSGMTGPFFSTSFHGQRHAVPYFQIEIRQDLIASDEDAAAVGRRVASVLDRFAAASLAL